METRKYIEFENVITITDNVIHLEFCEEHNEDDSYLYKIFIFFPRYKNILFITNSEDIGKRIYMKCRNAIVNNTSCYIPFKPEIFINNEKEEMDIIDRLKTPFEKEIERINNS